MHKYRCVFSARRIGALGISSTYIVDVEASDKDAARLKLYETYEHIYGLTIHEVEVDDECYSCQLREEEREPIPSRNEYECRREDDGTGYDECRWPACDCPPKEREPLPEYEGR